MSRLITRPYAGASDLRHLIEFAQRVAAATPDRALYYHPGDFVWQLAALDASDDVRLWLDGERVVACCIFEPPVTFQFDVEPPEQGRRDLFDALLSWVEGRHASARPVETPIAYQSLGGALSTWAMHSDAARIGWLEARGYTRSAAGGIRYGQRLDGRHDQFALPRGASVRHVLPSDTDERIDLHRDAWSVWGASTFDRAKYERLRAAPLYDPELDIVVEFEGRLASYCICWTDAVNKVGYFEPVGTRPAYTRRGLGRGALHEGLRRLRERGMAVARVGTASINTGAQTLYRSAGFIEEAREYSYSKTSG